MATYQAFWVKSFQRFQGVEIPVPGQRIYIPVRIEHNASEVETYVRRLRRRKNTKKRIAIYRLTRVPGSIKLKQQLYDVV